MRIGITGASGMLGTALISKISKSHKVFATSRDKGLEEKNIKWDCFDLTNTKMLYKWLNKTKPELVIHCAAIVNVDLCEENIELATALHVESTEILVNFLNSTNSGLIYISTDSVFNGEKSDSYNETDLPEPLNIYARTKLQAEKVVQSFDNGLVLRTNIIGWTHEGKTSFFEWLLKNLIDNKPMNLFHDVYFSPLTVEGLSSIIENIILNPILGLYHCASSDSISKYDFGIKVSEIFQLSTSNINSISVDNLNFKAARPKNMALNISKISSALEYDFPSVTDSINLMKRQFDKRINDII